MVKRILVTGGAGFIGGNLCRLLVADGNIVTCLDNLSSGALESIKPLLGHSRFTFVERDVLEPLDVAADQIFNLASPASPRHYQRDPVRTLKTNVIGTLNLLDLAAGQGATIVQASTSEVYGDPLMHPQAEGYWGNVNPTGPRAAYDEGKRAAETLLMDYHRTRGTKIKIARIFNTYGPGMLEDDGRVVSNFIVQALRGMPLTIFGQGMQTRSFCYVDDLLSGLVRLADSAGTVTGPINLGNPAEISVQELADLIIELTSSKSGVQFVDLPVDDPHRRQPDITLAGEALNWHPKVQLAEGLKYTIDYFDRLLADKSLVGPRP